MEGYSYSEGTKAIPGGRHFDLSVKTKPKCCVKISLGPQVPIIVALIYDFPLVLLAAARARVPVCRGIAVRLRATGRSQLL